MARTLLLTGATGALGVPLLLELLRRDDFDRIVALVRSDCAALAAILRAEDPKLDLSRLSSVPATLGTAETAHHLAALPRDVSCVVHATACTQFRAPMQQLMQANVTGTRQLLDWAESLPRPPRVLHLSTTCVAGARCGEIPEVPLPNDQGFVNDYEHTKWLAEQLAFSSPLRPEIVRLATLVGDSRDGRLRRPDAFHTTLRWLHAGLLPLVPGSAATRLDLLPSDLAVEFIARLLAHAPQPGAIFHVSSGGHGVPLPDLIAFSAERFSVHSSAWRSGHILPPVIASRATFDEFRATVVKTRDVLFMRVLESVDSFLPELFYPKLYRTSQAASVWGGPLALPPWRPWLGRVIDQAIQADRARQTSSLPHS